MDIGMTVVTCIAIICMTLFGLASVAMKYDSNKNEKDNKKK